MILHANALSKKYPLVSQKKHWWSVPVSAGTKHALIDVSFKLSAGVYGLLGPNGAGKSTLISILTDTIAPDNGIVCFGENPIKELGVSYRRVLGYMPQQQNLYTHYTGRQFIAYVAALKEINKTETQKEILRVAKAVNLEFELDKKLGVYSGGMKQRLLLACALLGEPKILILDEPTAGLDPKERVRLRDLLKKLAQDCIILVATHTVSDVESIADGILLLREGSLVDFAPVESLVEKYAKGKGLEAVYLEVFKEETV